MSTLKKQSKGITRRKFVKGTMAATAAMATVGPWVISSKVLASSGELNVLMWSDYLPPDWISAFTKKTGIKLNYTGIGSNEEIINKMKATKGEAAKVGHAVKRQRYSESD